MSAGGDVLDLRTYQLKPGAAETFGRIFEQEALPLLTRLGSAPTGRAGPGCARPLLGRGAWGERSGDRQVVDEGLVVAEGVGPVHEDRVRALVERLEHHEEAVDDRRLR